jgi:predicted metal-dependent peptidase
MSKQAEAAELVRRCKSKLLNISDLRLFGFIIYKFDLRVVDELDLGNGYKLETACCTFINKKPTIIFITDFILKLENLKTIQFVLLHEILHFLNHHLHRVHERDRHIWNIAGDHVINSILIADMNGKLKDHIKSPNEPEPVILHELEGQNMSTEEVYEWLMTNKVINISMTANGKIKIQRPGHRDIIVEGDLDSSNNLEGIGEDTKKEIQSTIDEMKASLRAALDNSPASRSLEGSKIYEFIDQLTKVELPWDVILEACINSTMVSSPDNRSWKNINRRMAWYGYMIPHNGMIEKKDNLILLIDTSGSISMANLQKFCFVIESSLNHFDHIMVIQHDYHITDIKKYTHDEFLNHKGLGFEIHGRGGTSHKDAFEKIEKDYIEGENIGMVIALTDYESDIEPIWNQFKWKDEIPFKLVLTENHKVDPAVDDKPIYIH